MSFINTVYNHLPIAWQNIAISIFGYYWQKRRFGGVYKKSLVGFKERETYSFKDWEEYQTKALRKILVHAYDNVPFYKKKYVGVGLTRLDLENMTIRDMNRLPFLEKDELREFGKSDLLATNHDRSGDFFQSSGSTGTPTSIYFSHTFHQEWSAAFESRIRNWAGLSRADARGMIGGRRVVQNAEATPPYYRYNFIEKQTYFSAYHISKSTAKDYVEGMYSGKIKYLTGYAMSNYFLAQEIKSEKIDAPTLKAVITSSEKLTNEMRSVFKDVYGCKTFDSYSGVEACGLISETADGRLLVSPDVGIMEFLDSTGNPILPGEMGEIVSTGLLNFDQPLIRYRIGDNAVLSKDQSSLNEISMPRIDEIVGRTEDVIIGKDGRMMVRFHSIFTEIEGLITSQLIQESISLIHLRLVVEDTFSFQKNETLMTERMHSQLGDIDVRFEYVDSLPLNSNGKIKAVISKIKK